MFSTRCEFCGTSPCSCHIRHRAKCLPPCQVKCIKGPRGCRGPQGLEGPQGPEGQSGPTGLTGPIGPIGLTGPQGPAGQSELTGPTGPQGMKGPTGPQGMKGPTGPQGMKGPTGPQGMKGPTGPQGPQGPEGQAGDRGERGPVGLTGPQGPQGSEGQQGQQGQPGQQGPIGPQGPVGPVGPTATGTPSCFFYATSDQTLQSGINFIGLGFESNVFSDAAIPMSCAGTFTGMVGKLTSPPKTVDLEIYKNGVGTGFILSWIGQGPMMTLPDPTWTEVPGVAGTYCKMSTGNVNVNVCDMVAVRSDASASVANAGFSLKFIQ